MPEILPQSQEDIGKARKELAVFKEQNDRLEEADRDPHWEAIDLNQLTEEEVRLWREYLEAKSKEDLNLLAKHLNQHREEVRKEVEEGRKNNPSLDPYSMHRVSFMAWLANKINGKMLEFI